MIDAHGDGRVTVMIVNPASGGGRCGRAWPAIERRLHAAGVPFSVVTTERRGDGTALARAALHAGATTVVAVGGDGTANEVVNGFFEEERPINPTARFGSIGAGTGNDLSRALGVDHDAAIAALGPDGITGNVDLLRVRFTLSDGQTRERYALLHVLMGVAGEGAAVQLAPRVKRFGRGASYLLGGAIAALRHWPQQITYRLDDGSPQSARIDGFAVANGAFMGGGLIVAPGARLDDGLADVIVVGAVGRVRLLTRLMPGLRDGSYLAHPAVSRYAARQICVKTADPVVLTIDGELAGRAPAEIALLPHALPIALPRR
ncbi:MAG: diacylglycerol/lipid kinase family protein [Thermomicrobiales bacterium]